MSYFLISDLRAVSFALRAVSIYVSRLFFKPLSHKDTKTQIFFFDQSSPLCLRDFVVKNVLRFRTLDKQDARWLECASKFLAIEKEHAMRARSSVCGPIAQSVEQLAFNQWVAGSSPARLTTFLKQTLDAVGCDACRIFLVANLSLNPSHTLSMQRETT